jgi:hypothetical protein
MPTEQHPVNGWERHVDVADTMLRQFVCHLAALDAAFTLTSCGRTLDADDMSMADLGRPGGHFNGAVLTRPPADWDNALARVERFAAIGRGQFHLWSPWPTPDLHDRGWQLCGHPSLMIRPPLSMSPVSAPRTPHLDVRRVVSASDLAAWERTAVGSHPLTELADASHDSFATPALLADKRLRFSVAWDAGAAVGAALSFSSHGIASLAFGTASPAAGCSAWRQAAIALLAATPDLWFAGVVGDLGRSAAEALGFVSFLRFTQWTLDRP